MEDEWAAELKVVLDSITDDAERDLVRATLTDKNFSDWGTTAWKAACNVLGIWPAWLLFVKGCRSLDLYEECKKEAEQLVAKAPDNKKGTDALRALERIQKCDQWPYVQQGSTFTARLKRLEDALGRRDPIYAVWKLHRHGPEYLLERLRPDSVEQWEAARKKGYPMDTLDRAFDGFGDGRQRTAGRAEVERASNAAKAARAVAAKRAEEAKVEEEKDRIRTAVVLASTEKTLENMEATGQTDNVMYLTIKNAHAEGKRTGRVPGMLKFNV